MTEEERKELLLRAVEFNQAFINLMQCVNRMFLNDGMQRGKGELEKTRERLERMTSVYSGNACPTCGMFMLVRTGTCLTCMSCGWNGGCG